MYDMIETEKKKKKKKKKKKVYRFCIEIRFKTRSKISNMTFYYLSLDLFSLNQSRVSTQKVYTPFLTSWYDYKHDFYCLFLDLFSLSQSRVNTQKVYTHFLTSRHD
jgi:hypothetical protein